MAQRGVTLFLLMVVHWPETSGEEVCYPGDLEAVVIRLNKFQIQYHETITAILDQLASIERNNSNFELGIADLKNKNVELEQTVQYLTKKNNQQDEKFETLEEKNSLSEIDIRNWTNQCLEQMSNLKNRSLDLESNVRTLATRIDTNITNIQEHITIFEVEVDDLKEKGLERDTKVQNLTQQNQQQDTDIETFKDQIAFIQVGVGDLKEKDLDLESIVRNLTLKAKQHDTEIEILKLNSSAMKVAFIARISKSTNLGAGETFVFTDEELDTANSYDHSKGKFMAPVSGTYLFSVQFCVRNWDGFDYRIRSSKATNSVHTSLHRGAALYHVDCSSSVTIILLEEAEEVWVESASKVDSSDMSVSDNTWNMFLGTRIAL